MKTLFVSILIKASYDSLSIDLFLLVSLYFVFTLMCFHPYLLCLSVLLCYHICGVLGSDQCSYKNVLVVSFQKVNLTALCKQFSQYPGLIHKIQVTIILHTCQQTMPIANNHVPPPDDANLLQCWSALAQPQLKPQRG